MNIHTTLALVCKPLTFRLRHAGTANKAMSDNYPLHLFENLILEDLRKIKITKKGIVFSMVSKNKKMLKSKKTTGCSPGTPTGMIYHAVFYDFGGFEKMAKIEKNKRL